MYPAPRSTTATFYAVRPVFSPDAAENQGSQRAITPYLSGKNVARKHLQLRQSVHFSGRCVRLTVKEGVRLFSEYKSKDLAYVGGTETKDRCSCSAWPSMLGGPAKGRRLSIALPRGMMVSLTVCFHGTMTQKETFMRKLLGHLLLFGVISSATLPKTVSADEPATGQADIAVAQNKCLGRGVNVLGYDPLWKDGQKARFQERYFRLIKEAGFSHIRVNLHPFRDNKLGPGNNLRAAWFETLDWTLKHALADNQEADGTIYDRVGTVGSYRSQGYCDSTDDKARFTDLPIAPDAEVHAVSSHASLRDKWALWSGPTTLRGANIWQKRVKRDDEMGDRPGWAAV